MLSTLLMLSQRASSTAFWTFLASALHASSAFFSSATFLVLVSDAFFNSHGLYFLWFLNHLSSMLVTLAPLTSTLVLVTMAYAGLTLLSGTPLTA